MNIPEFVIAGPDSIVASIPHIIGFTPQDSLVVMWLRDGCVRLTMRIDLPTAQESPIPVVDAVMGHRAPGDEVILCIMSSPGGSVRTTFGDLRSSGLMSMLLTRLGETDSKVRDALHASGDRWWSYLCDEYECCPPAGTPIDRDVAEGVAARFAFVGAAHFPDRQAVIALCAADPIRQQANRPRVRRARLARSARIADARDSTVELELWRDESIVRVRDLLLGPCEIDLAIEIESLVALCDVRVRDTVLWEVANSTEHDAHRAFDRAAALLRGAPVGVIAPIGSVTALLAWLIGDGVRAGAALDRVTVENPDYALADLLHRSISAGLPPAGWIHMMRGLARESCRGGLTRAYSLTRPPGPR